MVENIFVIGCIVVVVSVCIWLGLYINSPSNQVDKDQKTKDAEKNGK